MNSGKSFIFLQYVRYQKTENLFIEYTLYYTYFENDCLEMQIVCIGQDSCNLQVNEILVILSIRAKFENKMIIKRNFLFV